MLCGYIVEKQREWQGEEIPQELVYVSEGGRGEGEGGGGGGGGGGGKGGGGGGGGKGGGGGSTSGEEGEYTGEKMPEESVWWVRRG